MKSIDWKNDYYPLETFVTGPTASGGDLAAVRAGLDLLIHQKEERLRKLAALVGKYSVVLDHSDQSLMDLNAFVSEGLEPHALHDHISFEWAEVCLDTGTYIGETAILRHPDLEWAILEEQDPIHPYYHDIGLRSGTLQAPIFSLAFTYARNILDRNVAFPELYTHQFLLMIRDVRSYLAEERIN
ncbi:MAG: hypothetical protein RIA08_17060 [Roseovarius sp.]|uniref:hypothetical protein n=1 Tax=Roseovarius sp. TaxID=1486281 RepID=UPI0032EDB7B5